MRKIADGVWQLRGFPSNFFNVYLVGDLLIDAGTRWARRRILRELGARVPAALALTHCHPDHQGSAAAICTRFGIPLACHEADVPAMEGRADMVPTGRILRAACRVWAGPPHPVERVLRDGDRLGDLRVIHAPGHTPGHVFFWRETDRLVIAGDVLANIHFITGRPGLREPPAAFSADFQENRRSLAMLLALRPSLVCFGHGPPLRDMNKLKRLADRILGGH
ncbi:MAG: MBL fold metallo-hydrolase [Gemmataceae bacterium]